VKSRDIAGQKAGHFIGKIVNGKPPFFNLQFKECSFYEDEIPLFSSVYDTGDKDTDRMLMNGLVEDNYQRILDEVAQILAEFKPKKEEE